MKTISAILLLLAALPALAQEETVRPDYSRDSLQRFVMTIPPEPERERNMRFTVAGVEFRALGTEWRVGSLMLPFSGTRPTTNRTMPDPFELTGVTLATPFRAWRTQRTMEAELRRIEKSERARIRVKTK
jgi:hypothetical protein